MDSNQQQHTDDEMYQQHIIDQLNTHKREMGEAWMPWLMEQTRQMLEDDERYEDDQE